MSFYWVRKRTAVKKRLANRSSQSPGKVVFHTAVLLLVVLDIFVMSSSLFGNVLVSEMHTTTLHEIESCFLSFSFNRLHASQDCHYAAAERVRSWWRSVGFPTLQTGMSAVLRTSFFYVPPKPLFQHVFLKHSTRPLVWKWCIAVFRKFIYCFVELPTW